MGWALLNLLNLTQLTQLIQLYSTLPNFVASNCETFTLKLFSFIYISYNKFLFCILCYWKVLLSIDFWGVRVPFCASFLAQPFNQRAVWHYRLSVCRGFPFVLMLAVYCTKNHLCSTLQWTRGFEILVLQTRPYFHSHKKSRQE